MRGVPGFLERARVLGGSCIEREAESREQRVSRSGDAEVTVSLFDAENNAVRTVVRETGFVVR